jgi:hypothetical protein
MKHSSIALCLLAFASLASAFPEAHVEVADDGWMTTASPNAPEILLIEAAKKKVNAMLQTGKDESACKDLAQSTADEVTDNVAVQQKTLDDMPKGDECDTKGQNLVDDANKDLATKVFAQKAKKDALDAASTQKVNFGDFDFNELTENKCGSFFDKQVWKDAKAAVAKATTELQQADQAVTDAQQAVRAAEAQAETLADECRCKVKNLLEKTVEDMNSGAKAANTKAWNEAGHMLCVLDGDSGDKCSLSALPVVKPVSISDAVANSCPPPTPAPTTAAPTRHPTRQPTPAPTQGDMMIKSNWNGALVQAYRYSGGGQRLTWAVMAQVCGQHGKRIPGSQAWHGPQYCAYSQSNNWLVTAQCNWQTQGFTHYKGKAIPGGRNGYMCAHRSCDHTVTINQVGQSSATYSVNIYDGDHIFCEPMRCRTSTDCDSS